MQIVKRAEAESQDRDENQTRLLEVNFNILEIISRPGIIRILEISSIIEVIANLKL
jgi:hypothetical protein